MYCYSTERREIRKSFLRGIEKNKKKRRGTPRGVTRPCIKSIMAELLAKRHRFSPLRYTGLVELPMYIPRSHWGEGSSGGGRSRGKFLSASSLSLAHIVALIV